MEDKLTHFCNIKYSENNQVITISQTLHTFYKFTALLYCSLNQAKEREYDPKSLWITMNYKEFVDNSFVFGRLLSRDESVPGPESSVIVVPEPDSVSLTVTTDVFECLWMQMARKHIGLINQGNIAAIVKLIINVPDGTLRFDLVQLPS